MCECLNMCWDFSVITENGKWPIPNHHPSCKEHIKKRFIKLTNDEHSFIDTAEAAYVFLSMVEDSKEWKQEDVYLTQDQLEKLNEYKGF